MAFSAGDAEYRYTEQVGMLRERLLGIEERQGRRPSPFRRSASSRRGGAPSSWQATSDAGCPWSTTWRTVRRQIVDGKLAIAELPSRRGFPIAVKVVAWQFGRGVEPKVQTAQPVEQTIQIEKP